jgi:two-component system chemotaxis response regulator CheB
VASGYGPRVVGVILTGMVDDGTAGLMVVSASGGEAIVQDPESALFSEMPRSALDQLPKARVATLQDMPVLLSQLVSGPLGVGSRPKSAPLVAGKRPVLRSLTRKRSNPSCSISQSTPAQSGQANRDGSPRRSSLAISFSCRVGHALTAKSLGAEHRQAVEAALWEALRALEESASLYRSLAGRATNSGHPPRSIV